MQPQTSPALQALAPATQQTDNYAAATMFYRLAQGGASASLYRDHTNRLVCAINTDTASRNAADSSTWVLAASCVCGQITLATP